MSLMALPSSFLILLSILCCNFFLISQSFEFKYSGFNNSNLIKDGSASVEQTGVLRLTNKRNEIGHAFFPNRILMLNNSTDASSFSTNFIFQIMPSSAKRGGYGFAFTLSPSPSFPNADGKHLLGIFNSANDGLSSNHVFLVEFDTVKGHKEESDKEWNHVGININGMTSRISDAATYTVDGTDESEPITLDDGTPIQAWIEYDGMTKLLTVTISPASKPKPAKPLLSQNINDLPSVMRDNMYAGFSSATGGKFSSHYILGWSFKLNGIADPLNLDQIYTVPLQNFSTSNHKLKKTLISTFAVLLFILLVALGGILVYRRVVGFEHLEDWERDCPRRFRYRDLYKATKGFKESEIIGAGGFGTVYRGVLLANGTEIAVKKIISNNSLQGLREFAAEIESLGRLRHKNLVNLQGWCKHKKDLLLVYDYVPNGSLDSLLYNSKNSNTFLNWEQRFNIVKGIASGLLYLHEEWEQVVIHRDVKSSNVLIDGDMNARLGDFGLARLYDHGKNSHTTNVVGTIGYIAPELTRTGKASTSSDVFAFGVLLLEIACGRAPVVCEAERNVILVDWVMECMQIGNIFDAVDVKLNSNYVIEEMEIILGLGLLCSHPKQDARPNMKQVIRYLNGDELLPVFDNLSSAGSRRVDEITSRFLALGFSESFISTINNLSSIGEISASSFDAGR